MIFYVLLLLTYSLDMINMVKSNNTKDKVPYTIAMIDIGIIGTLFLKYGDNIQIIDRVFSLLGIKGGL